MTKKELIKMLANVPDDAEILVNSISYERDGLREPFLDEVMVVDKVWEDYDRAYDEVYEYCCTTLSFGDWTEGEGYQNKRKAFVL